MVKYNNSKEHFISSLEVDEVVDDEIINKTRDYNNYIKIVEPNLNKMIFSRKVLMVEGPNDLMVYKEFIRKEILKKEKMIKNMQRHI